MYKIFKTYIYKALNDLAPGYLSNSNSFLMPIWVDLWSSIDILHFNVPRSNR